LEGTTIVSTFVEIVDQIKSLLPEVRDPEGIELYDPDSADFIQPRLWRVTAPRDAILRLTENLLKIPEVAGIEGGVMHPSPASQQRPVKAENFAHWLLAQSRYRPPEECLEELLDTIRRNESPITEIIPIWGISPKSPFDLGNGLKVVPIGDLPRSQLKDLLMGKRRHQFSFEIANSFARAGAAITRETNHGPLYEGPGSETAIKSDRQSQLMLAAAMGPTAQARNEALQRFAELINPREQSRQTNSIAPRAQEIAEVIALLTPKPIFVLSQWYQRPENTPLLGRISAYSGPNKDRPFYISIEPQDYRTADITSLVGQYESLSSDVRKRLRTPLARLNQGRRDLEHDSLDDAVLDLAIAAEALLTKDRNHDASISYTIRMRGTLMLGGTAEERRENYAKLRDLYDLRNRVAHRGSVADDPTSISPEALAQKAEARERCKSGQRICTELILAVIRQGSFPDWDQLVFGW
jgi:Apea-like HEPN